jgi:SLIT-ROBO Rho GTPase activating protein
MDFGFHTSVAKCIYMYLSAQENIKRSRQNTVDNISRSVGDLDSTGDKVKYLEQYKSIFTIQKKFQFEPHKGDEVSQVNAQSLIRYEMEKRYEQLDNRLKTLKTENDEIFKTIEATENSLLNYFDLKNCDMSDLFRDLNLANHHLSASAKEKRAEIEDFYVMKVRQYTSSSNLISRLEARHSMMQKALAGCVNSSSNIDANFLGSAAEGTSLRLFNAAQVKKKKIGKSPLIGQPRLFGGKLTEYLNVTKQDIPLIVTSCIKAINRMGLHNQGIFRIPGSQLEVNQFKDAFEKGEDPLITVNPREMNSVAGVLKLYLRELKEPLFPRDTYDSFLEAMRPPVLTLSSPTSPASASSTTVDNGVNGLPPPPSPPHNSNFSNTEKSEMRKVENIKKVMSTLPKQIYIVIRYIFGFLNQFVLFYYFVFILYLCFKILFYSIIKFE